MGCHRRSSSIEGLVQRNLFPLSHDEWQFAIQSLSLTRQQARITELILQGRKDRQIAFQLELSEATVRTHLARLFSRLEIADRTELVLVVLAACRGHFAGVELTHAG